ncbi:hypothetical protein MKX03_009466 [Papaver bracteatum]|nr:hypothetical protein MKX03_009466 [Papaver bracteatum]
MISRVFSRMFSATKAIVENVHNRLELQQRLSKPVEVFSKADGRRRTMPEGSSLITSPRLFAMQFNSIFRHDTDLLTFQLQYLLSPKGSEMKTEAWKGYQSLLQQISYLDSSMDLIGKYLFGTKASTVMKAVRPAGQPVVRDRGRYYTMVETYEKLCGPFLPYGRNYKLSLANICNAGVKLEDFAKASEYACSTLGKMPLIYEGP